MAVLVINRVTEFKAHLIEIKTAKTYRVLLFLLMSLGEEGFINLKLQTLC